MYIISLHYIAPLSEVDPHIEAHMAYVNKYYETGNFLLSGRKNPRTGGVILAQAKDRATIDAIVQEDPFYIAKVAQYDITEFIPTNAAPPLSALKESI